MKSSEIERYNPPKYNKRVYVSGEYMEPQVIAISTDQTRKSKKAKALKQKKVAAYHEIIDVDTGEVFIEGKVQSNKKMKGAMGISLGPPTNAEQGSMHSGQATKKVDSSNNKGKDVSMTLGGVQMDSVDPGHSSNNFFDLDDYAFEDDYSMALQLQSEFDNMYDIEAQISWFPEIKNKSSVQGSSTYSGNNNPTSSSLTGSSSSSMEKVVNNEKRYESFKKFDTVVDFSDHYYAKQSSGMNQPPKNWAKTIQKEWRILEKDLPDTIFVRAYESRMDLLRAAIIGAKGTPYHDGLFFFDVCFTSTYPNTPPLVHYHSGGLSINPNIYSCGYVCLSLLNTWDGDDENEMWVPGTSTMFQVLVSIQGLVLNTNPYFNEPGYEETIGSVHGRKESKQYNEDTLISSLKTMVYTMKKPPKNFEDLVTGHFRKRIRDILMACKAYTKGVQVGCLVRKGVRKGNSDEFKDNVAGYVKTLVAAFKNIGAKGAEKFI